MKLKILKSDTDYEMALDKIESLMSASPGTEEAEELELWIHLVEDYERKHFPIPIPDPIDAIRFRMEQQGLKQKDLIPFIGSKSRVSEVLNRKRHLTLSMIRNLHNGLGIPAEVLLGKGNATLPPVADGIDLDSFPLAEMVKRRWFGDEIKTKRDLMDKKEELLFPFLMPNGIAFNQCVCYHRQSKSRKEVDKNAILAWQARVYSKVEQQKLEDYNPDSIDPQFIRDVGKLSILDKGPVIARNLLAKVGIGLVIEKNLPKTYLDGAAIRIKGKAPFIALSLRYDRIDNFWFTLCHELAHICLHLQNDESRSFLDDLDEEDRDERELEADNLAADSLIKEDIWQDFKSETIISARKIIKFASSIRIHPAIIAGRYQRDSKEYSKFRNLLGQGKVRNCFC